MSNLLRFSKREWGGFALGKVLFAGCVLMAMLCIQVERASAQIIIIDAIDFLIDPGEPLELGDQINLFPNPVSVGEEMRLTIPRGTEIKRMKIYNQRGKLIRNIKVGDLERVDTGIREPGVYRMLLFMKKERVQKIYMITR